MQGGFPLILGTMKSGPRDTHRTMEQYNKKTWEMASYAVQRTIRNTNEYGNATKVLAATFGETAPLLSLDTFVRTITIRYLPPKSFDEAEAAELVARVISGLKGEPQQHNAKVYLDGNRTSTKSN